MKISPYFETSGKITVPINQARVRPQRRELLTALYAAEYHHWQATGGDFLKRASRPTTEATGPKPGGLSRLWSMFLVGAFAAFLTGCTGSSADSAPAATLPPEVPVRRVIAQPVPLQFDFTGQTAASHQVDVRARVGGYVIQAPYAEGEFVTADTPLFEIDPRPFIAVHAKANAEVARAEAAVKLARQELARAERLAGDDAIAVEELERRATEVQTAAAALSAAVAQRESAELDLEFTRVKAPIAGRVSRALSRPGNLISGGDANGTLLTTLVATTPLHVLFTVDEPAFLRLAELRAGGQQIRAEVRLGNDDQTMQGQLDYLAPTVDARSGTAQARVVIPNSDGRLAPGLFARVTLITQTDQLKLLVPETAVGAQLDGRYVLAVGKENQLIQRTVVLGDRRGDFRVVTSGLQSGEFIVINGLQRVRPGMTVQPVEVSLASN